MAGLLSMSAIPKIFQNTDKLNQTQEIINQSLMQQHEDQARLNQTLHEDKARQNQSQLILNTTNASIANHQHDLETFMSKLNHDNRLILNSQNQSLQNQDSMLKSMGILLNDTVDKIEDNQLKVSKYGTENNALLRGIAEKLGINITQSMKEYFVENNITPIYPPPPKLPFQEELLEEMKK